MRWTTVPVSSSESLLLKLGINLPFPFFIESAICWSVCDFCHSALVKSGCPIDRQLGSPAPSFPWHSAHLLSYKMAPSTAGLPTARDGDSLSLAVAMLINVANNESAIAAESAASLKLFLLTII